MDGKINTNGIFRQLMFIAFINFVSCLSVFIVWSFFYLNKLHYLIKAIPLATLKL